MFKHTNGLVTCGSAMGSFGFLGLAFGSGSSPKWAISKSYAIESKREVSYFDSFETLVQQ